MPNVIRRRGVRGVPDAVLLGEGAANVKILGRVGWSEPADCGGVNANAVVNALALADPVADPVADAVAESLTSAAGRAVAGVSFGNADKGVSGYVIEKGPGVCVR